MIPGIEEINLPKYATLATADVTMKNMGEQTIDATLSIDSDVIPDFSTDWIVKFRGVEFIHPLKTPQASKNNTKRNPEYPLTFYHKAIYELKRYFFVEMTTTTSGTAMADKYVASLSLHLGNFVKAFQMVLEYYFGDYISIDLNPDYEYDQEPTTISISYSKIWDVLTSLYDNYAVSWWIEPFNGRYIIKVAYPRKALSHEFKYGFEGGLIKMERQVQSPDIRNILLGRGGDKNLPYRYYKELDSDNPSFKADPDWIPELANIHFDGLRDINFRYYIQGWKDNHYNNAERRYVEGEHFAYDRGFAATKFDPIEYVKDDLSISKYGELWGGLDAVTDIYPSIQGVIIEPYGRIDQTIDVEQITTDNAADDLARPDVLTETIDGGTATQLNPQKNVEYNLVFECGQTFVVKEGYTANLNADVTYSAEVWPLRSNQRENVTGVIVPIGSPRVRVWRVNDNQEFTPTAIPAGTYRYSVEWTFKHSYDYNGKRMSLDMTVKSCTLTSAIVGNNTKWYGTFDIWVKNIWETSREPGESDEEYANRVWRPILGDRAGSEAKVVFSTGMLSFSEDYEFIIVKQPVYDTSKSFNGVQSHWRITLGKIDADYKSTGLYLPNSKHNGHAGDYFFFIGIDMPHQYVVWAEQRLNAYKRQQLDDICDINPTWNIEFDRVRIGTKYHDEIKPLIELLDVGEDVILFSKWFISSPSWIDEGGERYRSTIQSITFSYKSQTQNSPALIPSVSVTLADKPLTTQSVVSLLQGDVNVLTSRINSMSAPYVIDVIRSNDDVTIPTDYNVYSSSSSNRNYINKRKDDETSGHITFKSGLSTFGAARINDRMQFGEVYVEGMEGIGGQITPNADAVLNSLTLRSWLEVPELRYNRAEVILGDQWSAPGGGIIETVEVDMLDDGTILNTGTITLRLENGEIGAIAVDDICKGYYHDFGQPANNATENLDDSRGNTKFAGFCTVFFRVIEILPSDGVNKRFRYMLRGVSERWTHTFHPFSGMHFVAYGNFTDTTRQKSKYSTRTYERYLIDVHEWEFTRWNIAAQFGDLSNLKVFGLDMTGYSAYLKNIYMTGTIEQFDEDIPVRIELSSSLGDWFISRGETLVLSAKVWRGWGEITEETTSWRITRDSGSTERDIEWNNNHSSFEGEISLTTADVGATSSLFTITAIGEWGESYKTIAIRTLISGGEVFIDEGIWQSGNDYKYARLITDENSPYWGKLVTSDVWMSGCKWRCRIDATTDEPSWVSNGWRFIEGDPLFRAEFEGWSDQDRFDFDRFALTLKCRCWLYNQDVSDDMFGSIPAVTYDWSRECIDADGNPCTNSDEAWTAAHTNAGRTLSLTQSDIGLSRPPRVLRYICTATLSDGASAMASFEII